MNAQFAIGCGVSFIVGLVVGELVHLLVKLHDSRARINADLVKRGFDSERL
jgi:hypothetical protein